MPLLDGSVPSQSVVISLVVGLVGLALALVLTWWLSRTTLERERRVADALNIVMAETVLRRDQDETLAQIFRQTLTALKADRGMFHLRGEAGHSLSGSSTKYLLLESERVDEISYFVGLDAYEPLFHMLNAADDSVQVVTGQVGSRWRVLMTAGTSTSLLMIRIGQRDESRGVMTLSFHRRSAAENARSSARAIGRYATQVLDEFDGLRARAREIQILVAAQGRHELLVRTTAHDLGNTLSMTNAAILRLRGADGLGVDGQQWMAQLESQMAIAGQMLADLTSPNRPLALERVPVERLIELVSGLMAPRREAGRQFGFDVPLGLPDVVCDRIATIRVVDNLLQNALRHNIDRDVLSIVMRARHESGCVEFFVVDDGFGIPLGQQDDLFEFVEPRPQVKAVSRGAGLGLWSCRRIIEAHSGQIGVDSEVGQGARFWFTLPVVAAGREAKVEAEPRLSPAPLRATVSP